jgi:hypothetical protein
MDMMAPHYATAIPGCRRVGTRMGVEHRLAKGLLNPAEALHLLDRQPHAGHFEILGADA